MARMEFRYIDTHAHLNLAQFDADREEVLRRTAEAGVAHINVGTRKETSELAVTIANAHDLAWAIVGIHPLNVAGDDPDDHGVPGPERTFDADLYRDLCREERVVGIGECGFDYFHYGDGSYELQRGIFEQHIELANEAGKPLMLHLRNGKEPGMRNAYDDALEVLEEKAKVHGNAHFYAGTIEQAKRFFDIGFTISFTGVITFAKDYRELVEYAPLDMIHGETDCPYVAPVPHRGERAEPMHVIEVYKKIAEIKGADEETVREQLVANARRLYRL